MFAHFHRTAGPEWASCYHVSALSLVVPKWFNLGTSSLWLVLQLLGSLDALLVTSADEHFLDEKKCPLA